MSLLLRRGKAPQEALQLSEQANRTLQELLQGAPNEQYVLYLLSISWYEIGKIHWDLRQTEETLVACRKALEAQRKLLSLAPTVLEYRQDLGSRYAQLGRKLCELGRLDEAEAYFRKRQELWPGDAAKHAETSQDLRRWATQIGQDQQNLSPEEQQERQRYLDLCARLESKGVRGTVGGGSGNP